MHRAETGRGIEPRAPDTGPRWPAAVRGFTLVEILVAVLVLSLGVLGAAGMQAVALRANREARAQEAGTRMATELAELIRANHVQAREKTPAANPYLMEFRNAAPAPGAAACFTGSSCASTVAIAQRDVADWAQRAAGLLPGVRVRVCYDSTPYSASGTPKWDCDDSGDTVVVKIGWQRAPLDSRQATLDAASVPAVVIPVTPAKAV